MKAGAKTLIVIAGPTAVGKTDLSLALAEKYNTEIISADSRQFFREMEIGTAKPSATALAEVKHHFINSHSIGQAYDAAQFGEDALRVLDNLFKTHEIAVMVGGSGLYIKAVCEGFDDIPEIPFTIREELVRSFELYGVEWLQQQMQLHDPDYFKVIDQKNPHRLIRALEVKIGTGKSLVSYFGKQRLLRGFSIVKIGLELPRESLYERIDSRMDHMIAEGLFDEARKLWEYRKQQALQTVGYKEIFDHLEGLYDKDEAIRLLKRNSRRYAKRQLTWFKKDRDFVWFDARNQNDIFGFLDNSALGPRGKEALT